MSCFVLIQMTDSDTQVEICWRVTDYVQALEAAGFRDVTVEHLPPPPADATPHPQFHLVRGTA